MTRHRKAIVVGAGLAGLASAFALAKRCPDVSVLEANAYPGGRAAQLRIDEFQIALGANLFLESYSTSAKMAQQLGVPLRPTPVPIHSGIYRNGQFHGLYGDTGFRSILKTMWTILSFQLLSPQGVWQAGKFAKMVKKHAEKLGFEDPAPMLSLDDQQNAAEFFAAEIGTEALEWLYGPGLAGYTFAHPEQVGIALAMAVLWHNGLNGVAWPCLPDGGMGAFIDALSKNCGAQVKLSTPVRHILIENGAVRGVVTDAETIQADVVICATTASTALELAPELPEMVRNPLRQVTYSKCCRVFFGVDSSPLPDNWYAVGFPRQTPAFLSGISNTALLAPDTVPKGKALIDALAIDKQADEWFALDDRAIKERALLEIRRYFPHMPSKPLFSHVQMWPEATCLALGGTMTALDRLRRQDYGGIHGLCFAGDYLGVPSVNAALRSGLDAAEAVLENFC